MLGNHRVQAHTLDPSPTPMHAAVGWLAGRARDGVLDLSDVLVATPGSRAGRVLVTMLAQHAQAQRLAFWPPRTITAGRLAWALAPCGQPADQVHRELAWAGVLESAQASLLDKVLPTRSDPDEPTDPAQWASSIAQGLEELANGGLRAADVRDWPKGLPEQEDPARWEALAQLQDRYEQALIGIGLTDPTLHALDTLKALEVRRPDEAPTAGSARLAADPPLPAMVVLIGCTDLGPLARRLLRVVPSAVHVLRFLPEGLAEDGVVDEAYWQQATLDVPHEDVLVTGGPDEQGLLAVRAALDLDTSTIGTADQALEGPLRRAAGDHGLDVHVAWGQPAWATGLAVLLADLRDLLAEESFYALSRVLRSPPVVAALAAHRPDYRRLPRAIDRYFHAALPTRAFEALPECSGAYRRDRSMVGAAIRWLRRAIRPLRARPQWRPLHEWAQPLGEALEAVLEPGAPALGPRSMAVLERAGRAPCAPWPACRPIWTAGPCRPGRPWTRCWSGSPRSAWPTSPRARRWTCWAGLSCRWTPPRRWC
ncbi:MAG: hypothetical protein KatS3mg103_0286 [Phycisphaerales bacterium]|nr:MAG: hypothetical protein KatS3mg103_0286 [Phycisphaerales bacterium]